MFFTLQYLLTNYYLTKLLDFSTRLKFYAITGLNWTFYLR